jgi:hypothetical protein
MSSPARLSGSRFYNRVYLCEDQQQLRERQVAW